MLDYNKCQNSYEGNQSQATTTYSKAPIPDQDTIDNL